MDWAATVARAELPAPLPALLDFQGTVVDLTEGLEALLDAVGARPRHLPPEPPGDTTPAPAAAAARPLPAVTPELADSLHTDVAPLQEIVDLLAAAGRSSSTARRARARRTSPWLWPSTSSGEENASHHQLVQFHPSYAYEDFFEGFRPHETDGGQATFRIEPGPLRRIASEAPREPGRKPFVLIIDEMNRANLAKVFGELYFLLEYRDRSIQLQYSPEEAFRLPENLFIIGTMNTADRSIALLDAAMRRRFAFIELHPEEPPVRDVLAKFLAANADPATARAALLAALNAAIEDTDRDFKIGPSYLMRAEAETAAGLERIWKHDILPLLEEHYYGRLTRAQVHERFGLAMRPDWLGGQDAC